MPTAKSYENFEIKNKPFEKNGKLWVTVLTDKGLLKDVRWYTEAQRISMDRAAEKRYNNTIVKSDDSGLMFNARRGFGFGEKGYITILKNDEAIETWMETLPRFTVWYNTIFGWFIPSVREIDGLEIPSNIQHKKLNWETVWNKDNYDVIDHSEIQKIVSNMFYEPSKSTFQGSVNDWLERDVKIIKNNTFTSQYGESHTHTMEDSNGNIYVWTTGSKNLEKGKELHIKMKVKEHKETQGIKQTIVWYCKVL